MKNFFEKIATWVSSKGTWGVDLFFVLSGFLITGILIDSKKTSRYFRNFYARRTLRIFPLYYAVLVVTIFILPMFLPSVGLFGPARQNQIWLWTYTSNYYLAITSDWSLGPLSHFWTLAIEEHFYLFWPVVVYFLNRRLFSAVCILIVIASPSIRIWLSIEFPGEFVSDLITPCRIDAMCIGGLFASALRQSPKKTAYLFRQSKTILALVISSIALTMVLGRVFDPAKIFAVEFRQSAVCVLFGILILWGINTPWRPRFVGTILENKVLRILGKYSYGLYVYHGILTWYIGEETTEYFASFLGNHTLGLIAKVVFATGISFSISWLSFELFEKRLLKLKRYFE